MKKRVYIAGPVTNNITYKKDFAEVADRLTGMGLTPINPVEPAPKNLTYKEYIDRGLDLLKLCDLICVICYNVESKGRELEVCYAETLNMPRINADRDRHTDAWVLSVDECWPGMFGGE